MEVSIFNPSNAHSLHTYTCASPSFGEIAHSLIKDDEFEGYRFPARTTFVWNHWGIHNSAKEYEQPERFWPDRFMNEDLDKPLKEHLGFGAGMFAQDSAIAQQIR